ncbi:MAG: hypothetical protein ACTSXD_05180 [Candidatus Heimdallarchaeaceae archaeon]
MVYHSTERGKIREKERREESETNKDYKVYEIINKRAKIRIKDSLIFVCSSNTNSFCKVINFFDGKG